MFWHEDYLELSHDTTATATQNNLQWSIIVTSGSYSTPAWDIVETYTVFSTDDSIAIHCHDHVPTYPRTLFQGPLVSECHRWVRPWRFWGKSIRPAIRRPWTRNGCPPPLQVWWFVGEHCAYFDRRGCPHLLNNPTKTSQTRYRNDPRTAWS